MNGKKMKIFLFEVEEQKDWSQVITRIRGLPMRERVKTISGYEMKLEDIKSKKVGGDVFLMDFCKHRESGPGRAKLDDKTKGFKLKVDERFGEMTALLYDPKTHFVVIQYNHYGPRPGAIAEYLSEFVDDSLIFVPRLKDDILAEIDKKQFNTSLSFAYSSASLTESHKKMLGIGVTVENLNEIGSNVGEVEITIKKGRSRSNRMENQTKFLRKILNIFTKNENAIKSAKITGSMTPYDKPEVLDILNARIFKEIGDLQIDQDSKMYSFESRCNLLIRSFEEWKQSDIITSGVR